MHAHPHIPRRRCAITITGESMCQVSDAKQADIHHIMRQFERTGVLNHSAQHEGTYGDFLNLPDYTDAQIQIAEARSMFETVPASIRAKHNNNPAQFVDWMMNPDNREAMLEQGFTDTHLPPLAANEPSSPPSASAGEPSSSSSSEE